MDFTWLNIFLFITVVSPAVLMLLVFRYFYPKARFVQINNFYLVFPMLMVSLFINVDQMISVIIELVKLADKASPSIANTEYLSYLSKINADIRFPWNLLKWVTNIFYSGNDLLSLVAGLHIRGAIVVLLLQAIHKLAEKAHDQFEFFKISSNDSNKIRRSKDTSNFFGRFLEKTSDLISHSWVRHTRHNKKVEILMVDVLTDDDNLYMGRLNDFTPTENSISSITLLNIFRFYSSTNSSSNAQDNNGNNISTRKQRLVKNSGELILLYERIKTIHIWNLKIGTTLRVNVYDLNSEEQLKWYVSLLNDCPHIFDFLNVFVFYESDDIDKFQTRFINWYDDNELDVPEEKINFNMEGEE